MSNYTYALRRNQFWSFCLWLAGIFCFCPVQTEELVETLEEHRPAVGRESGPFCKAQNKLNLVNFFRKLMKQ